MSTSTTASGESLEHLKHGDRRNVTVVFSDMEGFTRLAHQMDPEEVDALMGKVFTEFERIIERHGGSVEKYIGDALVAVFGAPQIHEDDPARAIHAALDFHYLVDGLNKTLRTGTLKFRTGIHTGLITTGKRGDYEVVTGHTMNVASRLQAAAEPGTILVSEQTYSECPVDFSTTAPLEIEAKGISGTILARRILGKSPHSLKEERFFTGHEDLIQLLLAEYLRFDGTVPGGVLLTGDPGIGKTAIVKQFLAKLRQYPGFSAPILHARARKFRTRPFAVITDMILNFIHLPPDAGTETICSQLAEKFRTTGDSACIFPEILDPGDPPAQPGRYLAVLSGLVRSVIVPSNGGHYTPIMFIDNADFIDQQSQDFLTLLFQKSDRFPFVVLTDRDPSQATEDMVPGIRTVEVPPLDSANASDLLRTLAGYYGLQIDPDDHERVLANTGGNPLFIHSYSRYLADRAHSRDSDDSETQDDRKPREISSVMSEIPLSVQNVYLAELTTYNDDIRDLLKKLSVFNHSFTADDARWLQEHTNSDPGIVQRSLEFFLQQEILSQDREIYFFRHDVQKMALYSSILNYNKKILHRLIAGRMRMQKNPHRLRLMHHLIRSESLSDAFEEYQKAPDWNMNLEYLPYLGVLAEKLQPEDFDTRMAVQYARCVVLFNNGMIGEAEIILQEIMTKAIAKQHYQFAGRAYHLLTAYNVRSFRFQKAYYCGVKALDFYTRSRTPEHSVINLLSILMQAEAIQNHHERAADILERLTDWGTKQNREKDVLQAQIMFLYLTRRYNEGADLMEQFIESIRTDDAQPDYFELLHAVLFAWNRYDLPGVCGWTKKLLAVPSLDPANRSQACSMAAVAEYQVHGTDPGDLLNQAAFYALRCQNDFTLLEAQTTRADALLRLRRHADAEAAARQMLPIALRHSAFIPAFSLFMILAETADFRRDTDELAYCLIESGHIHRMGMSLADEDLLTYLYLGEKYNHLLLQPSSPVDPLRSITAKFFADGDSRTVEQPAELGRVMARLYGNLAGEAAKPYLLGTRKIQEIVDYLGNSGTTLHPGAGERTIQE